LDGIGCSLFVAPLNLCLGAVSLTWKVHGHNYRASISQSWHPDSLNHSEKKIILIGIQQKKKNLCIHVCFSAFSEAWSHGPSRPVPQFEERCMELNLPWVLIEASQKRWTSEKMSLGQAGGKHTVKSLAGWWFGTFFFPYIGNIWE